MIRRPLLGLALAALALSPATGFAGKKSKALKSSEGGAEKHWMCRQLAESACDLAKRCDEPTKSLRHCRRVRERCELINDGVSPTATGDDVQVCAQAISELACGEVTFDNEMGVGFDIKHITACDSSRNDWLSWSLIAATKLPKPTADEEERTEGKEHANEGSPVGGGEDE